MPKDDQVPFAAHDRRSVIHVAQRAHFDKSSPIELSASLAQLVRGAAWTVCADGQSGGQTFRLDRPDRRCMFLKSGRGHHADAIAGEYVRLRWLRDRAPVPEVIAFEHWQERTFLVTTPVAGTTAQTKLAEKRGDQTILVEAIATFLRALHTRDAADCPYAGNVDVRLREARANIDYGRVDASDFDVERRGWSPQAVWDHILRSRPSDERSVLTHGDFTLDNVIVRNDTVSGMIDVARSGLADPYQDIAVIWRDLGKWGNDVRRRFLDAYGLPRPDRNRLEFYLCLDELF